AHLPEVIGAVLTRGHRVVELRLLTRTEVGGGRAEPGQVAFPAMRLPTCGERLSQGLAGDDGGRPAVPGCAESQCGPPLLRLGLQAEVHDVSLVAGADNPARVWTPTLEGPD